MLEWRTLVSGNDPKRWIKGTELESCMPAGFLSRFRIVSVRAIGRDADGITYDVKYRVRDAATVTDAEVKAGIEPRVIGEFATLEETLEFIEPARFKD